MTNLKKIIKKMVSEGYKLKAQHYNTKARMNIHRARKTQENDGFSEWELSDRLRDYLDTKSVIIMDTKHGQEVHYLTGNKTRQDLIDKLNKEKKIKSTV